MLIPYSAVLNYLGQSRLCFKLMRFNCGTWGCGVPWRCSPFSCSRLESIAAFPPGPHFLNQHWKVPSARSNKWARLFLPLDVRCGPFGSRRLVLLQIVRCYARKTQAILYEYIILLSLLRQNLVCYTIPVDQHRRSANRTICKRVSCAEG
jgi:hypothetical protein